MELYVKEVNMAWKVDLMEPENNIQEAYVYNTQNPSSRHLAYKIDKDKTTIEFFPQDRFIPGKIVFEGFTLAPPEFYKTQAKLKGGAIYYLNKMVSGKIIKSFTITKDGKNSFRKYGTSYRVRLNYESLKKLTSRLSNISYEARADRSITADDLFNQFYPQKFPKIKATPKRMASKVINNIDDRIIPSLSGNEIDLLINFVTDVIKKRYKTGISKTKLFGEAKLKVDEIALDDIIMEFESLLSKRSTEKSWGNFLKRNLFLLDSRYVNSINELSVMLARARKVDFGLVDYNGYLDIFEIKRASTRLLNPKTDRGNYFWHSDTVKAITQAEKYLYQAEKKASSLQDDIKRETGIEVKVIKPRAILIIGSMKQLDNENKKEDFRVLQDSLKNVEVIPYDDLFLRLKNLKKKKILI